MDSGQRSRRRDASSEQADERWELRLYVAGMTPVARRALRNLEAICQAHLHEPYELTIVDLLEAPERAERDQILAVPTLVRWAPPPVRKVIGDLSRTEQVLACLDLPDEPEQTPQPGDPAGAK